MKKILSLVLALALAVCAFAAMADGPSKTNPDIAPGGTNEANTLSLVFVDNTEDTQKVVDAFKAAFDAGDVLAAFPEDVRGALPEGLTKINEMLSAEFEGDIEAQEDSVLINIVFETPFEPAGDQVAVLFGKLNGEEVTWTVVDNGVIKDDGSVDVTLTKDLIKDLASAQPFMVAVASK